MDALRTMDNRLVKYIHDLLTNDLDVFSFIQKKIFDLQISTKIKKNFHSIYTHESISKHKGLRRLISVSAS